MLRVLVADDDLGTQVTFGVALQHAGYAVNLADSGFAAIAALSSGEKMDALLLDLNLGDMTGYDVLRWMRIQRVNVRTAVMTAFRSEFDPDEAIALGALAYADQPLSIDDVLALAQSITTPPSPMDSPQRLHAQVLAKHPGALECLDTVFLQIIPRRLERAFQCAPWDFAVDATADAILEYGANPSKFDPSRMASIVDFVYVIARRRLMSRLHSESTRKNRESRYSAEQVVLMNAREYRIDGLSNDLWAGIIAVTKTPSERRAAELYLEDADADAIAAGLGFRHLSSTDCAREAKRFKDRLLRRLSRYFNPRVQ